MNDRDLLMARTRAAVALLNSRDQGTNRVRMFAFLSMTEPRMSLAKRLRLANELAAAMRDDPQGR